MTLDDAWWELRQRVVQMSGPLLRSRSGWSFVVRRQVVNQISRALAARSIRTPDSCVELDDIPAVRPDVRVHHVEPAETLPGVTVTGARSPRFAATLAEPVTTRAMRVLEIPGGVVFGDAGWVGLDRSHLLVTGDMRWWGTKVVRREVERHRRGDLVELAGRTMPLLQPPGANGNYAHTLLQLMPLLNALDRAVGVEGIDRFLVPHDARPFVIELARRWGIEAERFEHVPNHPVHYRCETLVTGPFPAFWGLGRCGVVDPLRRRFAAELADGAAAPRRRWYLTRSPVWSRRVVNDAEVRAMLARRGFETLILDDRTVAEQASLLASAEFVVGVHGAALANLVFVPPGTPVLELMSANLHEQVFARLCTAAGLRYDVVSGREPCAPDRLSVALFDADIVVDVDDLATRVDAWLPT